MKKLITIAMAVAVAALFACGGVSGGINRSIGQLERSLEKVEKNKDNMTQADWEALEQEMEEPLEVLRDALESGKAGTMDRIKIAMLMGRWATVVMEAGLKTMENETGMKLEDIEKAAGELEKLSEEEGAKLEDLARQIEQAADTLKR